MLKVYHNPLGDPNNKQDPLPENLREITGEANSLPNRFSPVDDGKLYRSGIVWAYQIPRLQNQYGIAHIISLIEGDWLSKFYNDSSITIHQFPVYQRKELTAERVETIVDIINGLKEPALVHCLKGVTRTGMVSAGYQILNEHKGNWGAFLEYVWKSKGHLSGLLNHSTIRDIFGYGNNGK